MSGFFLVLHDQPFLVIFGVVALGMALGRIAIRGISLGSVVCIILVGLIASILSSTVSGVSLALPDVLKTIFFNLFIFGMGVKIGPQFFAGLERDGWHMVVIGLVVAILAPALSYGCGWFFDLPQGAVAGLLAGSNNSSASFGTAASAVQSGAMHLAPGASREGVVGTLSAVFALCYTISEVQFILFMKWLPSLARIDAPGAARAFDAAMAGQQTAPLPGTAEAGDFADRSVAVRAYRVSGAVAGRSLAQIRTAAPHVSIELLRRAGRWLTPNDATVLEAGDEIVVDAPLAAQVRVRDALGSELPDVEARALLPLRTVDVVVGRSEMAGRALTDLTAGAGPGISLNTIFRAGEELPTGPGSILKKGDVLRVTGTEPRIAAFGRRVGPVIRATHSSDVLTLAVGLVIGAALGAVPVPLFGARVTFGAAAVLVVGIVAGWLKTRHPALGGPLSEGARQLMEELGLNVFTAVLAVNAGESVYHVIVSGPIGALVISCLLVSAVPALVAWWIGRHLLATNVALLMGAIAGARQNTASLHAAQRESQSAVPGIGYPVPRAITTLALSVVAYFFAIFT
jgi:putative transport protein